MVLEASTVRNSTIRAFGFEPHHSSAIYGYRHMSGNGLVTYKNMTIKVIKLLILESQFVNFLY